MQPLIPAFTTRNRHHAATAAALIELTAPANNSDDAGDGEGEDAGPTYAQALDAEDIRRRMRAVYEAHGERPPPLAAMSNLLAAGTARRGTRNLRLLWLVIRGVARGVRWAWQPATDDEDTNRAQPRNGYRSAGTLAGTALLLTAAAVRSGGWHRWPSVLPQREPGCSPLGASPCSPASVSSPATSNSILELPGHDPATDRRNAEPDSRPAPSERSSAVIAPNKRSSCRGMSRTIR